MQLDPTSGSILSWEGRRWVFPSNTRQALRRPAEVYFVLECTGPFDSPSEKEKSAASKVQRRGTSYDPWNQYYRERDATLQVCFPGWVVAMCPPFRSLHV